VTSLVVLVGTPLVFLPSRPNVLAGPRTDLVVVCGAVLALVAAVLRVSGDEALPPRGVVVPLALLLGWAAVSTLASPWPHLALVGHPASRFGLVTIAAYAGVMTGAAATTDRRHAGRLLRAQWYGAAGVVLLYGALQLHDRLTGWGGRWDPVRWPASPFGRAIWSTLGNPNSLAGFLAIVLPIGFALLLTADRPPVRAVCAVMILVLLVELAVTGGRAGWLAALTGAVTLIVACRSSFPHPRRLVAATVLVAVLAGAAALALAATGHAKYRLDRLVATGPETTVDLRVQLWRIAGRVAADRPLLGLGPDGLAPAFFDYRTDVFAQRYGVVTVATDPHDVLLLWLVTTGVPGTAAFVWFLVAAGRRVGARWRTTPPDARVLRAGVVAALAAWLVQALFSRHDVALDLSAWALLGVALAGDT
jgi:O-antigen ligase